MPRPSALPLDIVGTIFEELKDDITSLRQCAIVSSDFLSFARKQLFRSVTVDYSGQNGHLASLRLVDVLLDNPEIVAYIKELHIEPNSRTWEDATFPVLLRRIARENCLCVLSLRQGYHYIVGSFSPPLEQAVRCILASTSIHTLRFEGAVTEAFPSNLLGRSPSLKHLSFSHLYVNSEHDLNALVQDETDSDREAKKTFCSIDSLALAGDYLSPVVSYLMHPQCPIRLSYMRTLCITGLEENVGQLVQEVVKITAQSLESLVWKISHICIDIPIDRLGYINLRVTEKLRFLEFHVYPDRAQLLWFASILDRWRIPGTLGSFTLVIHIVHGRTFCTCLPRNDTEAALSSTANEIDGALAGMCHSAIVNVRAMEVKLLIADPECHDIQQWDLYIGEWFPHATRAGYLPGARCYKY